MSFSEAEIIRKRAEAFLRNAKRLIEEGEYDLAVFNLEQYCLGHTPLEGLLGN